MPRFPVLFVLASLLLPACPSEPTKETGDSDLPPAETGAETGPDPGEDTGEPPDRDQDDDGYEGGEGGDCDDGDGAVHPGADEVCNGQDDDCDGAVDDGDEDVLDAPTWYVDGDGDGFGSGEVRACTQPAGTATDGTDCDDGDPTIHPGASETCDGTDRDCDGVAGGENAVTLEDGTAFTSLQDAIDAASTGETLTLCPGTWSERLTFTRDIALVSVAGAEATVVDASAVVPAGSTVFIRGGAVRLEGLTLTGGTGTRMDGSRWGGGIYVERGDGLELVDCVVEGNSADYGGGMKGSSTYTAQDSLVRTLFRDNEATLGGGGFLLFHARLEGVESSGNDAGFGGGGAVFYWDVAADEATVLMDNHATEGGGGLMLWDEGQWSGGQILGNTTDGDGGGVWITDPAALDDVILLDNEAEGRGGGLAIDGGTVTASGLVVHGNVAGSDGGGAVLTSASLECNGCGFGEADEDNAPGDILLDLGASTAAYTAGEGVTFLCATASRTCEGL